MAYPIDEGNRLVSLGSSVFTCHNYRAFSGCYPYKLWVFRARTAYNYRLSQLAYPAEEGKQPIAGPFRASSVLAPYYYSAFSALATCIYRA